MRTLICMASILFCLNSAVAATPVYQNGRLETAYFKRVATCNAYVGAFGCGR